MPFHSINQLVIALSFVVFAAFPGCATTERHDLRSGGPATRYAALDPLVEPVLEIETSRPLVGRATVDISDSSVAHADGVTFVDGEGDGGFFDSKLERLVRAAKSAAVLEACEKGATDFLVDPRYDYTLTDSTWFFGMFGTISVTCTVRGFPAKITGYKDVRAALWAIANDGRAGDLVRARALESVGLGDVDGEREKQLATR